jgi:hypothetical protein
VAAAIGDLIRGKKPASRLLQLHSRVHRRKHVGIKRSRCPSAAVVALFRE